MSVFSGASSGVSQKGHFLGIWPWVGLIFLEQLLHTTGGKSTPAGLKHIIKSPFYRQRPHCTLCLLDTRLPPAFVNSTLITTFGISFFYHLLYCKGFKSHGFQINNVALALRVD
jgi:hypothetical protein